jgi:hypothetical protein
MVHFLDGRIVKDEANTPPTTVMPTDLATPSDTASTT